MYQELDVEINKYLRSVYPNEGVVFIKDNKIIPVDNLHTEPKANFYVDGAIFMDIEPDAIAHSHPTGNVEPSEDDLDLREATGIPLGIYGTNPRKEQRVKWI